VLHHFLYALLCKNTWLFLLLLYFTMLHKKKHYNPRALFIWLALFILSIALLCSQYIPHTKKTFDAPQFLRWTTHKKTIQPFGFRCHYLSQKWSTHIKKNLHYVHMPIPPIHIKTLKFKSLTNHNNHAINTFTTVNQDWNSLHANIKC